MKCQHSFGVFLLIASIYVCSGCKKDEQTTPSPKEPFSFLFSKTALDYVKLTPGKYLIYKDSATSSLDSVVVTTSNLTNNYALAQTGGWMTTPAFWYQTFDLELTKFPLGREWFRGHASTYSFFLSLLCVDSTASVEMHGPENGVVFYSPTAPVDSVTIEGKTYSKVIIVPYDTRSGVDDPWGAKTLYFWAKGYGIIKRSITKSNGTTITYTLLRHNL